jgi:hypothetical protein
MGYLRIDAILDDTIDSVSILVKLIVRQLILNIEHDDDETGSTDGQTE